MEIKNFNEDLIGLQDLATRLEAFIKVEQYFVSDSLVLSLNAPYGSGKTTFLRMWQNRIEQSEDKEYLIVNVNAWKDDFCGDPLISILKEIIKILPKDKNKMDKIRKAANKIGWFADAITNQVAKKFTGVDLNTAVKDANQKASDGKNTTDIFEVFDARREALNTIRVCIGELLENNEKNLIVLVDELDRCRPDYAISYLETIKHVFNIEKVVFILAVDKGQLENSARAAFGSDLNFPEYYRKFIHREVSLPAIPNNRYKKVCKQYIEYYFTRDEVRDCSLQNLDVRVDNISALVTSMNLTFRQLQEMFRILGHVFSTKVGNTRELHWCLGVGTILMASLWFGNSRYYGLLAEGAGTSASIKKMLIELDIYSDWWLKLIYSGGGFINDEYDAKTVTQLFSEVGLEVSGFEPDLEASISEFRRGWCGYYEQKKYFNTIRASIEQISNWS